MQIEVSSIKSPFNTCEDSLTHPNNVTDAANFHHYNDNADIFHQCLALIIFLLHVRDFV